MDQSTTGYTWTYDEYARLPDDGNRYEVLDGEVLVTPAPSPTHQHVLTNLIVGLRAYVKREGVGVVLPDVDLLFVDGHFLRPDLVVVPESSRPGITSRGVEMPPALVVEILSPSSGSIDREKKPHRYGDFGVPEYWVADPERRTLHVWRFVEGRADGVAVGAEVTWHPAAAGSEFRMTLEDLFRSM